MITSIRSRYVELAVAVVIVNLSGCGDADAGAGGEGATTSSTTTTTKTTGSATTGGGPFASCNKGTLEPDFVEDVPLSGPGLDASGKLPPGQYHVATTYLALEPEQVAYAQQLGGGVVPTLQSSEGIVAFSFGGSQSCAALRTLSVWRTEEDMLTFVVSPAHSMAMVETPKISRGTSNTISWDGNEATASWSEAVTRLAAKVGGDR